MKRRLLALMLVSVTIVSATACSKGDTQIQQETDSKTEITYDEESAMIYNSVLGEFYDAYMTAKETDDISQRYALMAIAEGKLLGSAVMLPLTTQGGLYAISRLAPYTTNYTLWGNDNERIHQALVCTEPIKAEDRTEMKTKWNTLKGTGTYLDWAKAYLVENGYTLKDSYYAGYSTDPQTWDILATSQSSDAQMIVQTYDGLLEYDAEGRLQPALAESWTVSEDGLVYTFNIREGVSWVDSQGRKVDDVTADDFVAGMQHMMDSMGGLEYLVEGIILNAREYIHGQITDFNEVGVTAVDDYTLEYTLETPCSYFETMLGYSVFAPMSREYYTSKGGRFGLEYDSSAADYIYGSTPDNIAYCGPYLVTNATEKNTIVFNENESYWNADNIHIKKYTLLYNDGTDSTKAYNDTMMGTLDGVNLNAAALELAKKDGSFEKYGYVTPTNATSYMGFYNLNRKAFSNANDTTTVQSPKSPQDAERTNAAMNNVHFRRAISFAVDRAAYNAQQTGEELKLTSLRNTYTPANFVQLPEEVTVSINGSEVVFPAGTQYGVIVQAQLDADEVGITVFDPTLEEGQGSGDGFDGWYHPENAISELNIAMEELAAEGVVIDENHPIYIDVPYPSNSETYTNKAHAYKQSVESVLDGKVIINLVACVNYEQWHYAGYDTHYGYESNYDMYDLAGWGPDYGDPATYLDTFLPEYAGYMVKRIGIY